MPGPFSNQSSANGYHYQDGASTETEKANQDLFGNKIDHSPTMVTLVDQYRPSLVGDSAKHHQGSNLSGLSSPDKIIYGDEIVTNLPPVDTAIQLLSAGAGTLEKITAGNSPTARRLFDRMFDRTGRRMMAATVGVAQQAAGSAAKLRQNPYAVSAYRTVGSATKNLLGNPGIKKAGVATGRFFRNVAQATEQGSEQLLDGLYNSTFAGVNESEHISAADAEAKILAVRQNYQDLEQADNTLEQQQRALQETLDLATVQQSSEQIELEALLTKRQDIATERVKTIFKKNRTERSRTKKTDELANLSISTLIEEAIDRHARGADNRADLQPLLDLDIRTEEQAREQARLYHEKLIWKRTHVKYGNEGKSFVYHYSKSQLAQFELFRTILNDALSLLPIKRDELNLAIQLKVDEVADLTLQIKQHDTALTANKTAVKKVKADKARSDSRVKATKAELNQLVAERNKVQADIQDLLNKYSNALPEAELIGAIANQIEYLQTRIDATANPDKKAELVRQMDWLEHQKLEADKGMTSSATAKRDGFIDSLTSHRDGMLTAGNQKVADILSRAMGALNAERLENIHLSNNVGQHTQQINRLESIKRSVIRAVEGLKADLLAADSSIETDSTPPESIQQLVTTTELLQRLEATLTYEIEETQIEKASLSRLFSSESFRLTQPIEQAEQAIQAAIDFVQGGRSPQRSFLFLSDRSRRYAFQKAISSQIESWTGLVEDSSTTDRLRSLINFGLLVADTQPDFFEKRVLPEVDSFVGYLEDLATSLTRIESDLSGLIDGEQQSALTAIVKTQLKAIAQIKRQLNSVVEDLQAEVSAAQVSLTITDYQQQVVQREQARMEEQANSLKDQFQQLTKGIQSGALGPSHISQTVQTLLRPLVSESINGMKSSHLQGQQLRQLKEKQSQHLSALVKQVVKPLTPTYQNSELAAADLRDSVTTVTVLKAVYGTLAQTLQDLQHDIESLRLDVAQGKALETTLEETQKRFVEQSEAIKFQMTVMQNQITSRSGAAAASFDEQKNNVAAYERQATSEESRAAQLERNAQSAKEEGKRGRIEEVNRIIREADRVESWADGDPNKNWEESAQWQPKLKFKDYHGREASHTAKTVTDDYWAIWKSHKDNAATARDNANEAREKAEKVRQSQTYRFWEALQTQWAVAQGIGQDVQNSVISIQQMLQAANGEQEKGVKAVELIGIMSADLSLLEGRLTQATQALQEAQTALDADWSEYATSTEAHDQAVSDAIAQSQPWNDGVLTIEQNSTR